MSAGFTLHGSPHSLPTYRVALMLRLCRERLHVSLRQLSARHAPDAEFRALSRWGQVPVLEHNGRVFVQSAAILDIWPIRSAASTRTNDEARQHVREWLFWDADRLMPPLYAWYSVELGRRKLLPLSFDPVLIAEFDRKGRSALDILDAHLSGRRFLVGDAATIADICCYSDIAFARLSDKDLSSWRNVIAWAERIEALPGFAKPFDLLAMQDAEIAA